MHATGYYAPLNTLDRVYNVNDVRAPLDAEKVRANAVRGIDAIRDAVKKIDGLREAARPAIPALIEVLKKDESPLVRQFAVTSLAGLSEFVLDRDVMDAWVLATRDKDPMVRWWATVELKQMAPNMAIAAGIK